MPAKHAIDKCDIFKGSILQSWFCVIAVCAAILLVGCATPSSQPEERAKMFVEENTKGAVDGLAVKQKSEQSQPSSQLPVRYQRPSYHLGESGGASNSTGMESTVAVPVGAKYSPAGPKPLYHVMKVLAELKSMNVSWANDVDRSALVYVTVMPEEDFFEAIENILRQLDYYYELQRKTIVIKHKETKRFHIAMPFLASTFSTSVGGDVLGSTEGTNMSGTLNISSNDNQFDIWTNIKENLDTILEIWTAPLASVTPTESTSESATTETSETETAATALVPAQRPIGKGYYVIDQPIGLITVTAPRSLLTKVEDYLNSLKKELYRQISIEAKIIEVTLTGNNTTGVDWSSIAQLSGGFGFTMDIGQRISSVASAAANQSSFLTMNGPTQFSVLIDAMKKQGNVEVLSNPKISVMNGQPAMISVGENVTYVDSVSSTTTDGVTTFSISTASIMSGLGLGVIATIMENDEIILAITPVTSSLSETIQYETIGTNKVGIPKVNLREMNTMVRVKNGEMLVVGGLIDNKATYANDYVSGLGEVPFLGKMFKTDGTETTKKELIILMRPQIISF